jgi:phosphotransferase system HPr-like phosphotransfer protein
MSQDSAAHLLLDLRAGGEAAQSARQIISAATSIRAEVTRLLAGSVIPADHTLACCLLRIETDALTATGSDASEALYTLVALVARFADPHDALLIWRARQATPETQAGVDVEQMARLGLDGVRRYLCRLRDENGPVASEAEAALVWLDEGERDGAFGDLAGYFAWSDERFGVTVSSPT